jgi:hypothetical protein
MHGAQKDRFVACKRHVTEELRVNRGGLGRYKGFIGESFCSRLGCGELRASRGVRVEWRGRRKVESN